MGGAFPIQRTWKSSRLALQVERRKREREGGKKRKSCCCFLYFNANTMSNPLDISALTAAAVAELHKQQVASSANSGMPSASNVQEQMQQLKQRQESAAAVAAAAVSNNPITTSIALPATIPATNRISTSDSKLQMPTRHSWEMDWLSCELVKAREQIKKLKEENEQLRLKLESQNQFVVHSSRPVQQQAALDLTKQQNLEALLKSNQQLQAQLNPSHILAQNISQLAGLTASKPDLSKLSAAAGATQTQNLHELQKQMLGTSNFQELQNLCDQASVSSGPMDMSKVEKLLLAVQAEAAKKQ